MIPQNLSIKYQKICNSVSKLHSDWKMFRYLFADTPSHYDLFNNIDWNFFSTVHSLFYERVCMSLCRLGDPAKSRGNHNLTLESLRDISDKSLYYELDDKLSKFRDSIVNFKKLRDKYYGHCDKEYILGPSQKLFSRADVEDSLSKLREFMNTLRLYYGENPIMYEYVMTDSNGEGLIFALKNYNQKTH